MDDVRTATTPERHVGGLVEIMASSLIFLIPAYTLANQSGERDGIFRALDLPFTGF